MSNLEGLRDTIIDEDSFKSAMEQIRIAKKDNQQVSVFAYGNKAVGVTEVGFHYSLTDYTLDPFNGALGTSNDIVDDYGEISVKDGTIIIIETQM